MSVSKIKIDKELLKKAREHATKAGYTSVEEFVSHIIEKEISRSEETASEEEVKKRLKGLGYIS
jgi:metal-responsive CopG/Arc/MetJ family transcriptional regulator